MIEINLKWQLASSKKDTSKLKLKIEKKSIGLDTSIVIPYLLIKKCDWQNNNIRNIKTLYSEQIKAFDNIKNDIDTYLSYTNDLNKDNIIDNIKNIILKNDYRQKANAYDNMLLSKHLSDELDKKINDRAKSTVDNYKTNIGKLKEYEDYYLRINKKPLLIKNYNESFIQNFINYQANQENYYKTYPMVKSLKGVFRLVFTNDERMINIITKSFTPIVNPNQNDNNTNDDLPFELEIFEKMFNLKNLVESEEITRQWLVIACYTGLRVEDLLNKLNENQIDIEDNIISIIPDKTKKHRDNVVHIPIWGHLSDYFKKNNYKFPKKISKNEYSKNIKLLYKKVDSTTTVNREKRVKTILQNGNEGMRKVFDIYSVYQCFAPHDCRRFFVTTMLNNKLLTPEEIMIITGHKDLKTLMIYDKRNKENIMIEIAENLQGKYITNI